MDLFGNDVYMEILFFVLAVFVKDSKLSRSFKIEEYFNH